MRYCRCRSNWPNALVVQRPLRVALRLHRRARQLSVHTEESCHGANLSREPWNKGKLIGQKAAFKLKEIWAIRVRLQIGKRHRELALFNLGIDSKLRACDLLNLRVRDVSHGTTVAVRAIVLQRKTQRPVQLK